ncbi:MAG: DVUA0089 family protein [Chloroflexota bacterium]
MSSEPLQEAYRLIREGSQQEAVRILVPLVRADPLNPDAWWLLANAIENQEQKRQALERVLKLRPGDEAAQKMLTQLGGSITPTKAPRKAHPPAPAPTPTADDDEFTDLDAMPTGRVKVRRSRRRSPLMFILALISLLTVVSCGVCIVITAVSVPSITTFVQGVVLTITFEPDFATLASLATPGAQSALIATVTAPDTLPSDLQIQGSVQKGQVTQNTINTFRDDGWTYAGKANEQIVIEVEAVDAKLDPHLYLYDPNGKLIAENDDIDGSTNRNSRIDMTLPSAGSYTIRVSAFADGGAYKLTVESGT